MAIDQTDKALNMGSDTVNATKQFMDALNKLLNLETERDSAGLILTAFDADFASSDSGIKHVDGTILNSILFTSVPAISAFMIANNHDDNLNKAIP